MSPAAMHPPKVLLTNRDDLIIPKDRQRVEYSPESISDLAGSITSMGLLHPVVTRQTKEGRVLVAGWRRTQACEYIWNFGDTVRCGGQDIPENILPCIDVGDIDDATAFEIELEENIQRENLSWQDKARATSQLFELRNLQSTRDGTAPPTVDSIAAERGQTPDVSRQRETVRRELIVSRHLNDPDIAKAKSAHEAFKVLKRKEELSKSAALGLSVGLTFSSKDHTLLKGNCLPILVDWDFTLFDVILTDPPYGMGADTFGDSSGKVPGSHFYEDSPESWRSMMKSLCPQLYRIAKPNAHAYVFCDIDRFHELSGFMTAAGWKPFRTPLTWVNPSGMRIPWIDRGPQRKTQWILYCTKGDRNVFRLASDVITFPSDENLNHHAQKPVGLYRDLLTRSARAGDSVIDPFCGTGTIFPAAHELKIRATGIELDDSAHGIAVQRLGGLK